jgi:glutamate racemase
VRIALVDSGLGLLPAAAALRRLRPDVQLVLSLDTDGMPWGPRPTAEIAARALAGAEAADAFCPDVILLACNTASVGALAALRARFEPAVPVVGTVPAVKPAAAAGEPFAIWATVATTGSDYQRRLVAEFAAGLDVEQIACPGLAEAIERGAIEEIAGPVADAALRTPRAVRHVVLGCTHYALVADRIRKALPDDVTLHDSASAVAAQALRRADALEEPRSTACETPDLVVLASGRREALPAAALRYAEARRLLEPVAAATAARTSSSGTR